MDDAALLRRYAETRDEAAFTEWVRRHLDGVYSIALRRVGGDVHLAEDIAQQVFLAAARDAKRLARHPILTGWLYTTTRHASANFVRGERRRKAREQQHQAMQDALSKGPGEADWNQLAPVIEAAVDQLGDGDRVAVLLRFVERRTFGEIGSVLRLTEDAARKRVDRALEKLRVILGQRGVDSSAAALAAALTTNATTAAPSGLVATVAGAAMAGAAAGGGALTFIALMSTTKFHLAIAGAALLAGGLGIVSQQQTRAQLQGELTQAREENREIQRLRSENARLTQAAVSSDRGQTELQQLTREADALKQRLTDANAAAKARMRPMETLQDRGRTTPADALESLFNATWTLDYPTLGKMVAFTPGDQGLAEALFARIPEELRTKVRLTRAEDVFAMTWVDHNQGHFAGLRAGPVTTLGPDDVAVQFDVQRGDHDRIESQSMHFHRAADGWQWLVPTEEVEHTVGEAMHDLARILKPAP